MLQNGAETYFVRNTRESGYADFALVRQADSDGSDIRAALSSLPHFLPDTPFAFLTRHGIGCGSGAYVTVEDGYETVRFSRVPVWNPQVCDSTLLLMFDMMALSSAPQAVFVCGDIDVARIRERSGVLSMMASSLGKKEKTPGVEWVEHDSIRFASLDAHTENAAAVKLIYSTGRTSPENMNTILPLVTGMYAEELGNIIASRLGTSFRLAGIPVTGIGHSYKDSSQDAENERFSLSMVVPADRLEESLKLAGSILASLDRNGATQEELMAARNRMVSSRLDVPAGMTNSQYLDKCLKSYKFGASIASRAVENAIVARRGILAENELGLFNDFASAILDPGKNLVLRVDAPPQLADSARMVASFQSGWANDVKFDFPAGDIQSEDPPVKVRLSAGTTEPTTAGTMWTFSNGIKVIFKNTDTPGEFRYAFLVNGGLPSIPGIATGESAFAEDMFGLCGVERTSAAEFRNGLALRGISMKASVSMSALCLSGSAPSDRLSDVFDAVRKLASGAAIDKEDYGYYLQSQQLERDARALYPRNVNAVADSILSPGYAYPEWKGSVCPGDDFSDRMAEFFRKSLSRMNDGVVVLSGDFQPDALKKMLPGLVGGLKTAKGMAVRQKVSYPMISGRSTRAMSASLGLVGGKELGVNLCLSMRESYDNAKIMAFRIAARILEERLAGVLAGCGYCLDFSSREDNYPRSSFTIYADCRPCRPSCLPSGIEVRDQLSVMSAMRELLDNIGSATISGDEMKACKAWLKSSLAEDGHDVMLKRIEARYCEGKDLVSGTGKIIDGLTEKDVREMLEHLVSGAGVEYIIL
uniref:Peptidase M16C associated domain-containing protein n=1 Tax=uncultured bacterium fosmid pJB28H11 TaxID=1478062 RepID=A0A0H3UAE4_9BACT|nr:hypothetical protein [uncultured bacterium fosmid pJB28H11]